MAETPKSLASQVQSLSARLERMESRLRSSGGGPVAGTGPTQFCRVPVVPERQFSEDVSDFRARLIRYIDKKWVNGTKLRYYFMKDGIDRGGADQMDMVRDGFKVWSDLGIGISFEEVNEIEHAEVRIGFRQGDGAWSYVGRDVIDVPGAFERTMNFGWDLTQDPRGVDTPAHEIGHTLGFPHEHQNPFSGIEWDEEAVYSFFGGSPNFWDRNTTFHNVLRKLPASSVEGSEWDPNSVMHYGFPAGLILQPEEYRNGITPVLGLSASDIAEVRRFYPPIDDTQNAVLEPFKLELLSLAPAEQKNFTITPANSDDFTIQTFGRSDTLMVLFEEVDGNLEYVTADDDSGTSLNARLNVRLLRGRKYVLRVRLYLNYASGNTALLMW